MPLSGSLVVMVSEATVNFTSWFLEACTPVLGTQTT
jgi:hypothetical protein